MSDSDHELTIERTLSAKIEDVFKAWTDPEILAQWWGPNGVTIPVCKLDVKEEGKLEIVMLAGEDLGELAGSEWPMTGIYKEISPPTKLVYTSSAIIDGKPILDCLNTLTLQEQDGKTKLTLHIEVTKASAGSEGPLAGMSMGWNQSIDKLAKLVQQ